MTAFTINVPRLVYSIQKAYKQTPLARPQNILCLFPKLCHLCLFAKLWLRCHHIHKSLMVVL